MHDVPKPDTMPSSFAEDYSIHGWPLPAPIEIDQGASPFRPSSQGAPRIWARLDELHAVVGARAVEEIATLFLRNWSGRVGRAVVQKDLAAIRCEIVRLKGDGGMLGVPSFVRLCDEILRLSFFGSFAEVLEALDRLGREFDHFRDTVRIWKAARGAPSSDDAPSSRSVPLCNIARALPARRSWKPPKSNRD